MKQRIALVEFQFAGLRPGDGRSCRQHFWPRCPGAFSGVSFLRFDYLTCRIGARVSMAGNTVSPFIALLRIKSEWIRMGPYEKLMAPAQRSAFRRKPG
jgi:hypothetical protein